MRAVDQFKAPEATQAGGDVPSAVPQTIQEESDEEEVRKISPFHIGYNYSLHWYRNAL